MKKKPDRVTPIEQALMGDRPTNLIPLFKVAMYPRNPDHPYGTCWQCGTERKVAGGCPNGFDSYWCENCGKFLFIRAN